MGVNKFDGLFRGARAQGVPVAVRNVSKCFGDTQVLQDFTLDIPAGQFLTVIGRSGCGKSTLLRLLAGLETQDSGDLILDGDPHARPARLARVMFQEPRLLPWASVIDNVDVGLGSAPRTPGAEHDVRNNLEAVGLETRADDRPAVLSGGQKQRVALARALVSRPRILAFDEPLGALDALTRIEMQALLEKVWMEQRFTAILVTHDVSEALALGDRVVLIEGGRIALDLEVRLPRPRRRGSVELATLEERILNRLLGVGKPQPDYVI